MGHSCSRVDNSFCGSCNWKCTCNCCPQKGQQNSCPSFFTIKDTPSIPSGFWDQYIPPEVKNGTYDKKYTGDFGCQCTGLAVFIVWVSLVTLALLTLALLFLCAWRRGWWCFRKKLPPAEPQPQWHPAPGSEIMQQSPVVYPPMAYQAPAIGYPMPQPGIMQMVTKDAKPGMLKEPKPVGF